MKLSLKMGIPLDELQERVSSREFLEYLAHFKLEPWGEEKEDYRTGILASTIANVFRSKNQRPFQPDDFIPKVREPQTIEEQLRIVETLNIIYGGKNLKDGNTR